MDVIIASKNPNKIEEIKQILKDTDFRIIASGDLRDLPDVEEDGLTFEENARKKALTIAKLTGRLTLADDSGLEVDALNKRPGVRSARYAGENATHQENNLKLLEELKNVPVKKRTARFVCVIAIARPSGKVVVVDGKCEGIIANEVRGKEGFGYDPLFIVPEHNKTFAELGSAIKNKTSHRAIALGKAKAVLKDFSTQDTTQEKG